MDPRDPAPRMANSHSSGQRRSWCDMWQVYGMVDGHMSSDMGSERSPAADASSGEAALAAQMRALLQELHAGAQSIPDGFLEHWPAITSFRSVLPAPLPVLD